MDMRVFVDNQKHVGNKTKDAARVKQNLATAIQIVMKGNQEVVIDKRKAPQVVALDSLHPSMDSLNPILPIPYTQFLVYGSFQRM